jgi:hypothetical protein
MTEENPKTPERKEKAKRAPRYVQPSEPQASGNVVFVGSKPVMNCVLACMIASVDC